MKSITFERIKCHETGVWKSFKNQELLVARSTKMEWTNHWNVQNNSISDLKYPQIFWTIQNPIQKTRLTCYLSLWPKLFIPGCSVAPHRGCRCGLGGLSLGLSQQPPSQGHGGVTALQMREMSWLGRLGSHSAFDTSMVKTVAKCFWNFHALPCLSQPGLRDERLPWKVRARWWLLCIEGWELLCDGVREDPGRWCLLGGHFRGSHLHRLQLRLLQDQHHSAGIFKQCVHLGPDRLGR